MNIGTALTSVQRLYIETAPLIYYVEENPTYVAKMDAIITAVENTPIAVLSSVITLTEMLPQLIRFGNTTLEQEYRDTLLHSAHYRLVVISLAIADSAVDLRARYNLRTPDALHAATAIATGYDAFLTNDAACRRVAELRVLVLDELKLDLPNA